jgi:hypothetical protein
MAIPAKLDCKIAYPDIRGRRPIPEGRRAALPMGGQAIGGHGLRFLQKC